MPVMSAIEGAVCRSAPWRYVGRRHVLPWALDSAELSGHVLEIGGGSGAMAAGVARTFPQVSLTVTDLDARMVTIATRQLAAYPQVSVERADVTAMTYADASFDTVASFLMLHHVVGWRAALGEVARVLRPGGALIGYDLTDTRVARWIHALDRSPHRLVRPGELTDALSDLGLVTVTLDLSAVGHLMRFHAVKADGDGAICSGAGETSTTPTPG